MSYLSSLLFRHESDLLTFQSPEGDDDPFVHVTCGPAALTALLTRSGKLYMIGQNFYGQCGHGVSKEDIVWQPVRVAGIPDAERVVAVSCGFEHVLAATHTGALYSWGRGDRGQLGHGDTDSYQKAVRVLGPSEIFLDTNITGVVAGVSSSVAVADDGRVFVWGKMMSDKEKEQRGGGAVMQDQIVPRLLSFSDADSEVRILHASAGQAHMSFLDDTGRIWMTGLRGRGRLFDTTPSDGDDAADVSLPEVYNQVTPLEIRPGPLATAEAKIRCLRSSLHYSYAVLESGHVYRWGWKGIVMPAPELAGVPVLDVHFGYVHGVALVPEGSVPAPSRAGQELE